MKLFTIGYEQRKADEFFELLRENGIDILIDIRAIAFSRRKEFSKTALSGKLGEVGIEYVHLRELGGPKELRDKVKADGDYDSFFREYARHLDKHKDALDTLLNLARSRTACLLCYERDVNRCHRRAVAERIRSLSGDNIDILNL